ncbi:MAG: hypothetical protein ACHQW9_02770 [Nitrososphaerales archaeon]
MSLESVLVLPPYWFAPDTFDSISLKERIEKLMEMREKINSEIAYLKSIIPKQVQFDPHEN